MPPILPPDPAPAPVPSPVRPSAATPTGPAATTAPTAGAPLATTPGANANGAGRSGMGGIWETIKGMFVDPAGNMKTTSIISTIGLGALGAWLGSGSGTIGLLLGGVGGAVGGALGAPLIQQAVDWVSTNVLGIPPAPPVIPRNNVAPSAAPDTVVRTDQPIVQPGAPTVNTTLVTPNLDRFADINTRNVNTFTRLEDQRRRIETMPANDPNRQRLTQEMLANEGILQQYVSNSQEWNTAATQWNAGERNNIIAAYDRAQAGLGFPARASGAPAPIPEAPTGTITIARPTGVLAEVSRRAWNNSRPAGAGDWESMDARQQIATASTVVDGEIARLRPGVPGGINIEPIGSASNGRGVNRTLGNVANVVSFGNWKPLYDDKTGVHNRASNAADVQLDIGDLLRGADGANLSPEVLARVRSKAQLGMQFCDEGPSKVYTWGTATPAEIAGIRANFQRVVEYTDALEARGQIPALQTQVNQTVGAYVNGPAAQFPTFVTNVQGFRDNVNQMNQQVASLNQNQVRITGRGASSTPPDENKKYVTVRDERNNTEITMVAEKSADNKWKVTHTFAGGFNAANMTEANRLNPQMEIPDMFTDAGVRGATPNIGAAIRQALVPMQARLGITAAPAVGTTTVTPTPPTVVTPPPATPPGTPPVPGAPGIE